MSQRRAIAALMAYLNLLQDQQAFPVVSAADLEVASVPVVIQIDGRTRGLVQLGPQAAEAEALNAAGQVEAVARPLEHAKMKRVVYVPGRILNLVTT